MFDVKLFSLMVLTVLCLFGCKSTLSEKNLLLGETGADTTLPKTQEIEISEVFNTFFVKLFEQAEKTVNKKNNKIDTNVAVASGVNFKEFNGLNTLTNIRLSVDNNPKVLSTIGKLKSYEAEIEALKSIQALTSDVQAIGGLKTENRDTRAAVAVILSTRKLIYDASSSDLRIESKNYQLKSGEMATLIAADFAALQAYTAWIDLIRYRTVNEIYYEGFNKAQPLLEQIESVSMSGLSDKKALLAARRNIIQLQDKFSGAQSMLKISEEIFLDSFQGSDLSTVIEAPTIEISGTDLFSGFSSKAVPTVQEKLLLKKALLTNIKGLEASERPQVAFNASVNAPAENTLDDSIANAGLRLTYNFNDGGSLEAQIDQVRAEFEILSNETDSLEKTLRMEYQKQSINHETSLKRILTLRTLIEVSEEILEMARQQLVSGRSTIKDVLDAEVSLSTLKIDQINAESDALIRLLATKAYKDGLTKIIGWSY